MAANGALWRPTRTLSGRTSKADGAGVHFVSSLHLNLKKDSRLRIVYVQEMLSGHIKFVRRALADRIHTCTQDQAIRLGLIRINDKPSAPGYVIRSGDLLTHLLHRHEPPVHLAKGPGAGLVHQETDDFVVVDKPASLPVHPSGLYHHNSLTVLLAKEHKTLPQLYPVHRLDRLTSGLQLLAKSAAHAKQVGEEISSRNVRKHYVARVHGAFPSSMEGFIDAEEAGAAFPAASQDERAQLTREQVDSQWFWRMNAPLGRADATGNVRGVTLETDSQHAETMFRRLRTIEGTDHSLVECRPLTGRTHQIRAHLQHLGFPIVNDPIYGSMLGEQEASQVRQLPDMSSAVVESDSHPLALESTEADDSAEQLTLRARSLCVNCRQRASADHDGVPASLPLDFAMGLHAFKYEAKTWSFTVPFPSWAT